jgi:hypothetical protein
MSDQRLAERPNRPRHAVAGSDGGIKSIDDPLAI